MSAPDLDALPSPYPPTSERDRTALRDFARNAPLAYGTWGALKRLYKAVEAAPLSEPTLFGALAARMDTAPLASVQGGRAFLNLGDAPNRTQIAARNGLLYAMGGDHWRNMEVGIYDLNTPDPLKPRLLSAISLEQFKNVEQMVLNGSLLCLVRSQPKPNLSIYDVSDPLQPRPLGTLPVKVGGLRGCDGSPLMCLMGTSQGWSGLQILDVSRPDQPAIRGEAKIENVLAADCGGELACVIVGRAGPNWNRLPSGGGLRIVDVTRPDSPKVVGSLDLQGAAMVTLIGRLALVGITTFGSLAAAIGVQIVDLSDPSRPRKLGFCPLPVPPGVAQVRDGLVFCTVGNQGLRVLDVSDPNAPRVVGTSGPLYAQGFALSDRTAYVTTYQGVVALDVTRPARLTQIGLPPSAKTLAYLKRRVRRVLRVLAKSDSDAYVRLAYETLAAGVGEALDPARHWASLDILYGASDHYAQRRHGRGPLVPGPARLRLRTREERMSEAWNRHPEFAIALLSNPGLPWQTHDAAFKMLRDTRSLPFDVSEASLTAFVSGASPPLIHFATPLIAAQMARSPVPSVTVALAYVKSGAGLRRVMESRLPGDAMWGRAFAERVLQTAQAGMVGNVLPRRLATACEMVARRFPSYVPAELIRTMATALLNAGQPGLTDLVVAGARQAQSAEALAWLMLLDGVTGASQERGVQALEGAMAGQAFSLPQAQALTAHTGRDFPPQAGWRLLAASTTGGQILKTLWTALLDGPEGTPGLRIAMASPAALSLLERAGLTTADIAQRLRDRPFLAGLISPQTFAALLPTVSASVTLQIIAAASEDQWPEFRASLLRRLREMLGLDEFWLALEPALANDDEGRLRTRLLGDPEIAETFGSVTDPAVLSLREAAFGPVLGRWVRRHESLFPANSALLLQAATHVLADVRDWALARVRTVGQTLPFALRLLESSLPPSMEVGSVFFDRLPTGDPQERLYALALCDSPFHSVRRIGQQYVTDRWETLPREDLLRALFESDHADTQAFVAGLLAQSPARPGETARFDREVLRTRQKSRRAKEQVKARQSVEPTVDVKTLLAMARSRTPRDAEWALGELAKRALAGQEIEGFAVSGVSGG